MSSTRRTTICREGWYYTIVLLLVFSAALVREINLLMVLAGMMAGPLLLSRFMAIFTLHGLQVRRKMPQYICAGDLLVCGLTLSNTRRRVGSWAVVVEEPIRRESNGDQGKRRRQKSWQPGVFFPYLPAGQSRKGSYRGRLTERGRYQLGPLRLATRFPFGLFCHTVTTGKTERLVVFPRLGRLTRQLGRPPSAVVCRRQAAGAAGRDRRRLLRHSPLAERRQPPLDSRADLRPERKTHGPPVRAAEEPRRSAAVGPLAARAAWRRA